MTRCICDDAEERIKKLKNSPFLHLDIDGLLAVRAFNKFDIEKDKQESKKQNG